MYTLGLVVLLTLAGVAVVVGSFISGLITGVTLASQAQPAADPAAAPAAPFPDPTASPGPGTEATSRSDATQPGDATEPPERSEFDPCLIGTWRGIEHRESYDTDQGPASITGLSRTLTITADGIETITYDGNEATVTTDVGAANAIFDGEVRYRVGTTDSTMSFELLSVAGTITIVGPNGETRTEDLQPGTGDVTYGCDETTLRQEATGFLSVYRRTG